MKKEDLHDWTVHVLADMAEYFRKHSRFSEAQETDALRNLLEHSLRVEVPEKPIRRYSRLFAKRDTLRNS